LSSFVRHWIDFWKTPFSPLLKGYAYAYSHPSPPSFVRICTTNADDVAVISLERLLEFHVELALV
jgi:hypothetical protein